MFQPHRSLRKKCLVYYCQLQKIVTFLCKENNPEIIKIIAFELFIHICSVKINVHLPDAYSFICVFDVSFRDLKDIMWIRFPPESVCLSYTSDFKRATISQNSYSHPMLFCLYFLPLKNGFWTKDMQLLSSLLHDFSSYLSDSFCSVFLMKLHRPTA